VAEHEFYRQEIVIDVTGDEQAKGKLKAMDNYLERTSARARKLDKARVSPTVSMNDKISGRLNTTMANLRKLTQKGWKITLSVKDNITNKLSKIRGKIWSMTKQIATSPLTMLGVGGGIAGITGHSLGLAGEKEGALLGYETMLGGMEKALEFQRKSEHFALKTPFEMPQLRDATKLLLAYQFEAEKVLPYMRIIGDTTSGLNAGAEGISAIVRALGQMKQTGRVNAQDMMQLTNVGVADWQILADKMGKSVAEIRDMSEKGLIPAHKAIEMLLDGMDKGTKNVRGFGGLMDKQSKTLFGMWSNIKDFFNQRIFTKFGEGLSSGFGPGMQRFLDKLDRSEGTLKKVEDIIFNTGRLISTKLVGAMEKAYRWVEKLSSDTAFRNMDFAGKLSYILSHGIAKITPIVTKAGIQIGFTLAKGIVDGVLQAAAEDPKIASILGLLIPGPIFLKGAAAVAFPAASIIGKKANELHEKAIYNTPTGALMEFIQKKESGESVYVGGTTMSAKKHALGGIFNRPHLGMFAEDGAEGIIPLSPKYRSKAIGLYAQVGKLLGISQFAAGGFTGGLAGAGGGVNFDIDISGINILWNNNVNEEVLAMKIGKMFVKKVKEKIENSP
jgi:tape measure domain-containing protein